MSDKKSGDKLGIEEKPHTNFNYIKTKSFKHNYSKSKGDMSDRRSVDELGTEKKLSTDPDCIENKSFNYNYR